MWIRHHEEHAPGLIEGLYLIGSVALDDWRPGSDVDIASKTAAGEWAMVEVPEHRDLIELAVAIRARHGSSEQVHRSMVEATVELLGDLADAITG